MLVKLKRIYDPPQATDGQRILVDRLWPRGLTKDKAALDHWLKNVAPSTELRRWFAHDPAKWVEFQDRYRAELNDNPAWPELQALVAQKKSTLLFAAKDEDHNEAVVLKQILEETVP